MPTLKDYLVDKGQYRFSELPLTVLDIACLNELGYLNFGEHLPDDLDFQQFYPLTDLLNLVSQETLEELSYDFLMTKERVELLDLVLMAQRFSDLEIGYYINDVSPEYERQFAAMVMRLPSINHTQIIFRGTDDTLIGWKEDFNMAYQRTIPAQYAATTYLRQFLAQHQGKITVSGHSKGGNLALYASSQLLPEMQENIKQIIIFDAPGLHTSILSSVGYQAIRNKVLAFRPHDSIVGIILNTDVPYQTVASQAKGLLQHDLLTWEITETDFSLVDGLSDLSLNLEKTFADWLNQTSNSDLKLFFDTFFDLFFTSGIASLNDLNDQSNHHLKNLLSSLSSLDRHRWEFMKQSVGQLLSIFQKNAFETAWQTGEQTIEDWVKKWLNHSLSPESHQPKSNLSTEQHEQ